MDALPAAADADCNDALGPVAGVGSLLTLPALNCSE
jgi:hypothetical protein